MFRGWFDDLEMAITAFRKAVLYEDLFCSISVNLYGDFVFEIAEGVKYYVKHDSFDGFTVWRNFGDWKNPDWKEIK